MLSLGQHTPLFSLLHSCVCWLVDVSPCPPLSLRSIVKDRSILRYSSVCGSRCEPSWSSKAILLCDTQRILGLSVYYERGVCIVLCLCREFHLWWLYCSLFPAGWRIRRPKRQFQRLIVHSFIHSNQQGKTHSIQHISICNSVACQFQGPQRGIYHTRPRAAVG